MTYTAEQIREHTKVTYWPLRRCGICNAEIGYHISPGKDRVTFDPTCDCTTYVARREPCQWQDIADSVNRQTEAVRQRMLAELAGEK